MFKLSSNIFADQISEHKFVRFGWRTTAGSIGLNMDHHSVFPGIYNHWNFITVRNNSYVKEHHYNYYAVAA